MDLPVLLYALLAAATAVVAGVAARTLRSGTREARIQSVAWLLVGVFFMQILVIAGLRPELTGAFVIAAALAASWTFMRKMVIRPRA